MPAEVTIEPFESKTPTSDAVPGRGEPVGSSPSDIEGSRATEFWTPTSGPAGVGWSWAAFEDTGLDGGGDVETCGRIAAVIAAREGSAGVTLEADRLGVGRAGEAERRILGAAGADAVPAVPLAGS